MKQIIFVRHAQAVTKESAGKDILRKLIDKGRFQAKSMAKKLNRRINKPDLFLSSPANRALETAQIFAIHWKYPPHKIKVIDELYNSPDEIIYMDLIKELPEKISNVIFFGHDPAISGVSVNLAENFSSRIPTNGVLVLQFKASRWQDIQTQSGKILFFNYPQHGKFQVHEMENHLYQNIYNKLNEALINLDESEFKNKEKFLKKWSYQITQNIGKIIQRNKSTLH